MCGIVGIVSQNPVNESIYAALTLLQHRGQDAAGIVTIDDENRFRLRKANGLVSDVFRQEHMLRLQGHAGVGLASDMYVIQPPAVQVYLKRSLSMLTHLMV